MALENYRPIQFPEKTEIDNTDVVLIDSQSNGTNKYQLSRLTAQAAAEAQALVDAEAAAREQADDDLKADLNVKTPIQYYLDHYVDLHVEPVNIDNLPETTNPGEKCAVVDCVPGDRFIINAVGGGWGRAWGFLDSSNMIISRADPNATVQGLELIAPANAVKLCINDHGGMLSYKILGKVSDVVADLVIEQGKDGITDDIRSALLACFANVAWINEDGQTYYDNLEAALYNDYPKIIATFSPGTNVIYTDDELDTLKQYLTVKYYTSKTDTGTTIPAENYTLSGILREGENTVRVTYLDDYKATFIVNAVDFYNIHEWSESNGLAISKGNIVTEYTTTIVSNETSTNRGIACCGRGKKDIYKYNNSNPVSFDPKKYPIPIPVGTKHVTMTYIGSFLANLNLYKYNENTDTYTLNGKPTYTERTNGTVSFETDVQDENNFILPLFLLGSAGVLPTDVNLTFSLD